MELNNYDGIKVIAFYLPQYHPTHNNNKWWGKGFTEWTNVGRAKPLFKGHYQPKVPADLGYYDLRIPEVREQQAALAREAGVTGFCYYHYWFEEGKEELDMPFKQVLATSKPDFPFCLCWANESWHCKFWNVDGSVEKQMLAEQKYEGPEVNERHFLSLLKAFKDPRYMTIDSKPIFMIYRADIFEGISEFIKQWNDLAIRNGFKGIYFIAYSLNVEVQYQKFKDMGFDGICSCRINEYEKKGLINQIIKHIRIKLKIPRIYEYKDVLSHLVGREEREFEDVFPTMVPNWDHTPRSGSGGYLYHNSTPQLFEIHADQVLETVINKIESLQICFLKSWNEWGEGNYMEPDLKYGKGFIYALRRALNKSKLK